MAKLEDDDDKKNGIEAHVTSLSVLRTHRKLGIATKLMRASHHQMKNVFNCDSCSLRVRVTNRAAISLYNRVLGYEIMDIDKEYYADKEDAYDMRIKFEKVPHFAKIEAVQAAKVEEEKKAEENEFADEPKEAPKEKELTEAQKKAKAAANKKKRDKAKAKKAAESKPEEDKKES